MQDSNRGKDFAARASLSSTSVPARLRRTAAKILRVWNETRPLTGVVTATRNAHHKKCFAELYLLEAALATEVSYVFKAAFCKLYISAQGAGGMVVGLALLS